MKSILLTITFISFFGTLSIAQNSVFQGKITIANDKTAPIDGTIRFNSDANKYEGYLNQQWVDLSFHCVCPYVLAPFNDVPEYSNINTTQSGQLTILIDFSHQMDPQSFIYGTNIIVSGNTNSSAQGTLVWSKNNTRLTVTTNESWNTFHNNCYAPFNIQIIGTGDNPARGVNGSPLDGDRDGCCGGDYNIQLQLLC